jgi:hypothetical protein
MTTSHAFFALATVFWLLSPAGRAQEGDPIDTDRPDQTESSALVAPRHLQLEVGLQFTDAGPGEQILESPTALIRLGVIERLELRFGIPTIETNLSGGNTTDFADPELGVKIKLWEERGARPQAALIAGTTIPAGSGRASSDRFDPAFRFAFGHTLPRGLSLGYNAGIAWATEPVPGPGGGRSTESRFEYTAALGYDITDRWGTFIEVFGDIGLSDSGGPAHSVDGGVTYLLRENLQLDAAIGAGLTGAAPDWFITAGVSYRFGW